VSQGPFLPHFVLDQNYPYTALRIGWPKLLRLSPLATIEPTLVEDHEDWEILYRLNQLYILKPSNIAATKLAEHTNKLAEREHIPPPELLRREREAVRLHFLQRGQQAP
jgi:hypothetical protein